MDMGEKGVFDDSDSDGTDNEDNGGNGHAGHANGRGGDDQKVQTSDDEGSDEEGFEDGEDGENENGELSLTDVQGITLGDDVSASAPGPASASSTIFDFGPKLDKYGFILSTTGSSANGNRTTQVKIDESEEKKRREADVKRTKKWLDMIKDWDNLYSTSRGRDLITKRIRKGVPDIVRGKVWNLVGGVENLIKENPGKYEEIRAKSKTFVPGEVARTVTCTHTNA
jgi:hypothetical protein